MTAPDSGASGPTGQQPASGPPAPAPAAAPAPEHPASGEPAPTEPAASGQPPAYQSPGAPPVAPRFGGPPQPPPQPPAPVRQSVPPGPGVQPPFAAPPVQKEGGTLALTLIIGSVVMVLCLVGGGIGLGSAVYSAFRETDREAKAAAGQYLDAIREQRYSDAYKMTCKPLRRKVDESEFTATKQRGGRIVDYELAQVEALQDGRLVVPATLQLESGDKTRIGVVMVREVVSGSGKGPRAKSRFRVCGEVGNPAPAPS